MLPSEGDAGLGNAALPAPTHQVAVPGTLAPRAALGIVQTCTESLDKTHAGFQREKLPSEAGRTGQGDSYSPRATQRSLFSGGSGNFHRVSSLPGAMNDCLGEKPVGSLLRRERYSLNEREFTTFLSMVTVLWGHGRVWIDSSTDTYIRVDTVPLASAKHMREDHFCHPGYVTFVTTTLSTTPTPCGPRSVGLEFPGWRPDDRFLCVGIAGSGGDRSRGGSGLSPFQSLSWASLLGCLPNLEFLTWTFKVFPISPPCLGMLRLALSCPMAASGPGGTTRAGRRQFAS